MPYVKDRLSLRHGEIALTYSNTYRFTFPQFGETEKDRQLVRVKHMTALVSFS